MPACIIGSRAIQRHIYVACERDPLLPSKNSTDARWNFREAFQRHRMLAPLAHGFHLFPSPLVFSLSSHNCTTAVRDFVRAVRTTPGTSRALSGANDSNNGCNEFKQFCITEWRGVDLAWSLCPAPSHRHFPRGQNLSAFT